MRTAGALLVATFAAFPVVVVLAELVAFAVGGSLVPWVEQGTGSLCHHDPERTPQLLGAKLAVCARCTGLYVGAALGGLLALVLPTRGAGPGRAARIAGIALAVGFVAALAEALGFLATGNATRVGLGALLGAPIPLIGALGGRIMARTG
ncbi:MAG: DUF2085 domain-containing protein [Myxococcales bacterium]|nr:DUF2085 domain-containing protein [Myxococcales bacterium]